MIGPAALAVYALNFSRVSMLDTVTLLFGYFLAEKLEPTNLFWVRAAIPLSLTPPRVITMQKLV